MDGQAEQRERRSNLKLCHSRATTRERTVPVMARRAAAAVASGR